MYDERCFSMTFNSSRYSDSPQRMDSRSSSTITFFSFSLCAWRAASLSDFLDRWSSCNGSLRGCLGDDVYTWLLSPSTSILGFPSLMVGKRSSVYGFVRSVYGLFADGGKQLHCSQAILFWNDCSSSRRGVPSELPLFHFLQGMMAV